MLIVCAANWRRQKVSARTDQYWATQQPTLTNEKVPFLKYARVFLVENTMNWTKKTELRRERMREVDESFG